MVFYVSISISPANWTRTEAQLSLGSKLFLLLVPSLREPSSCILRLDWLFSGSKRVAALLGLLAFISGLGWTLLPGFHGALFLFLPCPDGMFFHSVFGAVLHLELQPLGFCGRNSHLSHLQLCTTHHGRQFGFSFLCSAKSAFTHWHSTLQNLVDISL